MKKLFYYLTFSILCVFMFNSTSNILISKADSIDISDNIQTIYPENIDHYVDLQQLDKFNIYGNRIVYSQFHSATNSYSLELYNLTQKTHTVIIDECTKIDKLYIINDYIIYSNNTNIYVLDCLNDYASTSLSIESKNELNVVYNALDDEYIISTNAIELNGDTTNYYLDIAIFKSTLLNNIPTKTRYDITDHYNSEHEQYFLIDNNYAYIINYDNVNYKIISYNYRQSGNAFTTAQSDINIGDNVVINDLITFNYNLKNYFAIIFNSGLQIINASNADDSNLGQEESSFTNTQLQTNSAKNIKFYDNNIYIYNNTSNTILKYDFTTDNNKVEIKLNSALLTGKSNDQAGRFANVNEIHLLGQSKLYITDKTNKQLQIIDLQNNNHTTLISLDDHSPMSIIQDEFKNVFLITTYNSKSYINKIEEDNTLTQIVEVPNLVSSATIDLSNKIYMVDFENNRFNIVEGNQITNITLSNDIHFNQESTIKFLPTSNTLALSLNNGIHNYSLNGVKRGTSLVFNNNVVDFTADANDNLFVINNGNLQKTSFNVNEISTISSTSLNQTNTPSDSILDGFAKYTSVGLDNITGKIYLFNNNSGAIQTYTDENFSTGYSNFKHYSESFFDNQIVYDNILPHGKLQNDTQNFDEILIYDYPNFVGDSYTLKYNSVLFIQLEHDLDFSFIGYAYNNELKGGYVKSSDLQINSAAIPQSPTQFIAAFNKVSIYKYPTKLGNIVIDSYSKNEVITTYAKYPVIIDGLASYYVVQLPDNSIGYISKQDVVLSEEQLNTPIKTNATIKIYDQSKYVLVYSQANLGSTITDMIYTGQAINVIDYDKDSKFTKIEFVSNNAIITGYILTDYIDMDSINSALLITIIVIVSDVIIGAVIAIIFVKYRKKHLSVELEVINEIEEVEHTKVKFKDKTINFDDIDNNTKTSKIKDTNSKSKTDKNNKK